MGNVNSSGSSAGPVRHDRVRGRPVPSQTPELENSRPGLTRSRSSLSLRSCTTATTSVSPWTRFKRFLSVPASLLGEQQQESTEPAVEAMEETSEAKEVLEEDFVLVPGMDLKLMSTEIKQIAEGDPFARHPVLVDPEAIAWVRTHGKIVFIMRGLPGSGKSTLVNKLSKV